MKQHYAFFALALLILICIATPVFAAKTMHALTASVYQSSSATLGTGTALCTDVDISINNSCSGLFSKGFSYRWEVTFDNTGSTDADIDIFRFRNVYDGGDGVGSDATLTECGCYEDGVKYTGSFSTSGDDIYCNFTDPNWCTLHASGDTEIFYFVITIGTDAASDGNPDFRAQSSGTNKNSNDLDMTLATCGDDAKEGAETCDGTDLDSETCIGQGFSGGTLACESDCTAFDTGSCTTCGNNILEVAVEACDGTDLGGETCVSRGFESGTLACKADCTDFNTSACSAEVICGDGVISGSEACDGADLNSETCITQGYGGGTLACSSNCFSFNTSACTGGGAVCGDGNIEGSEVCDGVELDDETCITQGFTSGTLSCGDNCLTFNTSQCIGAAAVCGDNNAVGWETCDGTDLDGETCISRGFTGGTLACQTSCTAFDTSSCTGCSTTCDGSCPGSGCYGSDPDCDVSGSATLQCCGNGTCEGDNGENCGSCASDCGACPPDEGGAPSVCGDGICQTAENKCSCSSDCGTCSGADLTYSCKAYQCIGGFCQAMPTLNCCGNSLCEEDEDFSFCLSDCPTPKDFTLTPLWNDYYLRGETINLLVEIMADSSKAIGAEVEASGTFGKLELFDDGQHNDREKDDGIFSTLLELETDTAEGAIPIVFDVRFMGTEREKQLDLNFSPRLDIDFRANKLRYVLGSDIKINGSVFRRETPLELDVEIGLYKDGELVSSSESKSTSSGMFEGVVRLTTIDPLGLWEISAKATDEFGNWRDSRKEIEVVEPLMRNFLWITLNPAVEGSFKRGSDLKVIVDVTDINSSAVKGALLEIVSPLGARKKMTEISPGRYSGGYSIPWELGLGEQRFEIVANKEQAGLKKEGITAFIVPIEETEFITEILGPNQTSFRIGDDVEFAVKMTYASGEPVTESVINATINGAVVQMLPEGNGVYKTIYYVADPAMQNLSFSVDAKDAYENTSEQKSIEIEVSGTSWNYYARSFPVSFYLLVFAAIIFAVIFAVSRVERYSLAGLRKKEAELRAQKKEIETRYFKQGTINRTTFNSMKSKVEPQLEQVKTQIARQEEKLRKRKLLKGEKK